MTDLVQGLQQGDARAYEKLVEDYGDRLYRFARRMVGPALAEDVTQEVFMQVVRSIARFETRGRLDTWLFTIASNLCIDHLRRRRSHPVASLDRSIAPPAPSGGPSDDSEWRDAMLRAIAELPIDQKQVFLMREEAGLPFREIARILDCPLNTALGRMHYAMEHLRACLRAYQE